MSLQDRIKRSIRFRRESHQDNRAYGSFGNGSSIVEPMRIIGKSRIFIGDNVTILNQVRMETVRSWGGQQLDGRLTIGSGTSFEQCCHLVAAKDVTIGRDCVFSAFVYVSDCAHGYTPDQPIMQTPLEVSPVKIGDHCFVGISSCIMPGVTLGSNVVIGANSVVTKDIPDDCMAAGSPARIIKRYDRESGQWVACEE